MDKDIKELSKNAQEKNKKLEELRKVLSRVIVGQEDVVERLIPESSRDPMISENTQSLSPIPVWCFLS